MAALVPVLAAATALIAAAALAAGCGGSRHSAPTAAGEGANGFAGAALPRGVRAPRFVLEDQAGQRVALGGPGSEVTVAAFLYTGCGRVCFLVAQQVRGALDRLKRPVRALFVSVDPAADTRVRADRFLRSVSLGGRVRYLTGPAATLARVWPAYRITTPARGRAAFERAVTVLLIDRAGDERVLYEPEQLTPESLIADISRLQGEPDRG